MSLSTDARCSGVSVSGVRSGSALFFGRDVAADTWAARMASATRSGALDAGLGAGVPDVPDVPIATPPTLTDGPGRTVVFRVAGAAAARTKYARLASRYSRNGDRYRARRPS